MRCMGASASKRRVGAWLGVLGSLLSLVSANLAAACCGFLPAVGAMAGALGLGALQYLHVQRPILYMTGGLVLLGVALSSRRHRKPAPLVLAGLSLLGVLYPFHVAMEVSVFRSSVYGGSAGLIISALWNMVLLKRTQGRAAS